MTSLVRDDSARLRAAGVYRRLRRQEHIDRTDAMIDGRRAMLFSGNDYLGLAAHPKVIEAGQRALTAYGSSATASRLVSGNHQLYRELEDTLARFTGKKTALVFSTGYAANLCALTALAGRDDTIFIDRLGHASLYDGARLSRAKVSRYPHNDLEQLEALLTASEGRTKLIVTDGVFSMDGDLADLPGLKALSDRYGCSLLVDDAHGAGVIGEAGRGSAAHLNVDLEMEIGTLSKAFGGLGGYIAGPSTLIDVLVNRSRPFIFSTGLPPATLGAAAAAVSIALDEPWRRERVLALAERARAVLTDSGFTVPAGITPIVPILIGDEKLAVAASEASLQKGLFVPAIRTPAVPTGEARLRMTVSAAHSDAQLERALEILIDVGKGMALI